MLRSIGVENYRTFREQAHFELAPLTILVGANSSGKSSVTRLLPLLSQSITDRSAAPISWVSEKLDLGSFYDNVHLHDYTKPICFSLSGDLLEPTRQRLPTRFGPVSWVPGPFQYRLSVSGNSESTRVSAISIEVHGESVSITVGETGWVSSILFRGKNYIDLFKDKGFFLQEALFPRLYIFDRKQGASPEISDVSSLIPIAAKALQKYAHPNTSAAAIESVFNYLALAGVEGTIKGMRWRTKKVKSLHSRYDQISEDDKSRIWIVLFMMGLSSLSADIEEAISGDVTTGGYLAPVRASALRYYRRQQLAVDQIDPSGENLAIYLNSLWPHELEEINSDFERFFDHRVGVHKGEGHISVQLGAPGALQDNLADVGFGFSQLIPVVAQIHAATRSLRSPRLGQPRRGLSPILAIEQPELHLHPAYQAKLGEYFVHAATKAKGTNQPAFRFLIETHSEPLVNEVASLVARGAIGRDMVRLYLFERLPGQSESKIVEAGIEPDGSIPNWPFGFFTSGRLRKSANV